MGGDPPLTEPSLAADASERIDQTSLPWPARVTIAVALFGVYAPFFLYFLVPSELLSYSLLAIGAASAIPLAVFTLQALFRLQWKLIFVFVLVWVLLCLIFVKPIAPQELLRVAGFYVRTRLAGDYLSRCRLTEFAENGVKQTAGFCEGFDRGESFEDIIYDTTGGFMRPAAERTPEWRHVMSGVTAKEVVSKERRAYHLFGNYYCVDIEILDLKG